MSGLKPFDPIRRADLTQSVGWGHNVPVISNPPTPGRVRPDVVFERDVYNDKLTMADGTDVEYWAFRDTAGEAEDKPFPSAPIRLRQGQVAHTLLHSGINVHTVHHHGIEPSTYNDGVGHTSFHVGTRYAYQWRPHMAGTYYYHCHRNTVLHHQLGMYGFLVVDPPSGPGKVWETGPAYDAEALWAPADIDPAWRDYNHASGEDHVRGVRLNVFTPKYFTVNGVPKERSLQSPQTRVTARVGQTVLVRHLNAAYMPLRTKFPSGLNVTIVGSDARPLPRPYRTRVLDSTAAERYEILVTAAAPGTYRVVFEFRHWLRNNLLGTAEAAVVFS